MIPIEKFIDLLNRDDDEITIKRKTFGINIGKKECKIKCEVKKGYKKAKEKYSLLIESLFNDSIEITEEECNDNRIYDKDFIIEKMKSVITNYI